MSIERLISKLNNCKKVNPKKNHRESYIAQCPAHDDNSPSLNIDVAESGNILIKCWSGCGAVDVVKSVGMNISDLFPEKYEQRARRQVKDNDFHDLHLKISQSRRENGHKQTKSDKESELRSFMALRARR